MKIQEMDIMNKLRERSYINQRVLSEETGYSLGKVNSSLKSLLTQEYLDESMQLTQKAILKFKNSIPHNAIILAAGFGMRMVPINSEVPKGLLEVNSEPLIERIIKQLQYKGIGTIYIVVGFMKEQYEYLMDKYGVELLYNKDYASKNNLYSLRRAVDKLGNSYIVPCDIWCEKNPYSDKELYSWYMVGEELVEDSTIRVNRKRELAEVKGREMGNRMIGISYISQADAELLKLRISDLCVQNGFKNAFWEEALINEGKMILHPKVMKNEEVFEINTLEELRELDYQSHNLNAESLHIIANTLGCSEVEITNIKALKKGMTNRSFEFMFQGKKYIMRIPGEGTGKLIDRRQEYNVYQKLKEMDICDPVLYISAENGYKITEFLTGARACDPQEEDDVERCIQQMKKFHGYDIQVGHTFDLFTEIEKYERLWDGVPSIYRDYEETKKKMYDLKSFIDCQEQHIALTHIDAVYDNFLLQDDRVYMIDWEYAGMQDTDLDLAMFANYAGYGKKELDWIIDLYYGEIVSSARRAKIYCYLALSGLLWSNWCEYKRMCGVEFAEYSLVQYRYAKDFYKIAKKEMNHGE